MDKLTKTKAEKSSKNSGGGGVTSGSSGNKILTKPKEKRRSNEKRKEKSRDAARCRRSRETEIFTELASVIPGRREEIEQLDKASIMRLAISFLKVRDVLKLFPNVKEVTTIDEKLTNEIKNEETKPLDMLWNNKEICNYLYESLDGFLLLLSCEGDIIYASESISEYLGISQIDILGQPIWEYMHQCDHEELKESLNIRKTKNEDSKNNVKINTIHRDLMLRFKCTLTSRGRSVNIKSASYKVIHLTGHMIIDKNNEKLFIGVGRPLPHPSNIEIPMEKSTFLTKHSLDMKFTYVDDKMQSLLKYNEDDLLGKSLYDCHHGADSESLRTVFKMALSKGQSETCRYRFLGKFGGYCWLITQATVIYDKQKPQSIVCINYVISNIEKENEIYSCEQLEAINCMNKHLNLPEHDNKLNSNIENNNNNKLIHYNNKENHHQIIDENLNLIKTQQNSAIKSVVSAIDENLLTKVNNNNINNNNRENSLSPIRRTLNNCKINKESQQGQQEQCKTSKIITSHFTTNILNNSTIQCINGHGNNTNTNNNTKPLNDKRPKSVTASVLTQVRSPTLISSSIVTPPPLLPVSTISPISSNLLNSGITTTASSLSERTTATVPLNPAPINIAARAQSVTASVLTPVKTPTLISSSIVTQPPSLPVSTNSVISSNLLNSGTNSTSSGLSERTTATVLLNPNNLVPINIAPRAQSVTASIFKPLNSRPILSPIVASSSSSNIESGLGINNQIKIQYISPASLQNTQNSQHQSILHHNHQQQLQQSNRSENNMNKGFLSFADDTPELTMLKEEPDELSHLTPTSGDSCIQLDEPTPLFGEMLEGLILPDAYCSLLPDDINSLDSQHSSNNNQQQNNNNNSSVSIDPFINYRDESSDTNSSPHLLSPGSLAKSPEASSVPSLCSPHSLNQDDEFAFMTMSVDDDIDLTMRAPYIPMNEQDDLPLLTDDLMWSAFSDDDIHMHDTALKNALINCYSLTSGATTTNTSSSAATAAGQTSENTLQHSQHHQHHHQQQTPLMQQSQNSINLQNNMNQRITGSSDLILSNDSNLAHILCGGGVGGNSSNEELNRLRQQHDDNDCKKRKYEESICDSIDAFGQIFNNKNSSSLDCWTMNDILQLNSTNHDNKPNILINSGQISNGLSALSVAPTATTTTTIHVPLITIQNNQKINNALNTRLNITISNNCNNNSNNSNNHHQQNIINMKDENGTTTNLNNQNNLNNKTNNSTATSKLLTSCNPTTLTTGLGSGTISAVTAQRNLINNNNSSSAILNLVSSNVVVGGGGNCGRSDIINSHNNNKRHLNGTSTLDSKRAKNNNSLSNSATASNCGVINIPPPTSSASSSSSAAALSSSSPLLSTSSIVTTQERKTATNLLQQLMAPTPQQQRQQQLQKSQKLNFDKLNKWADHENIRDGGCNNNNKNHKNVGIGNQGNSQQSPSNSVLKNLLVSGCDVTSPLPPIITDDNSQDSIKLNNFNHQKLLSPYFSSSNHQQHQQQNRHFMRSYGTNPMIGGVRILPSPSLPYSLNSPMGSDSGNDSGIECNRKYQSELQIPDILPPALIRTDPEDFYTISIPSRPSTPSALSPNCKDNYVMTSQLIGVETIPVQLSMQQQPQQQHSCQDDDECSTTNKISSLYVMDDTSTEFASPSFIMDLCNDDYNTAPIMSDAFLTSGNDDLSKDFTDWTAAVI